MPTPLSPAARVDAELATHFEALDKSELVEMLVQMVKVYAVEGVSPLFKGESVSFEVAGRAAAPVSESERIGEESIAAMLKRLQQERRDDPLLQKFVINGEQVSVRVQNQMIPLSDYPGSNSPRPAAAPAQPVAAPARGADPFGAAPGNRPAAPTAPAQPGVARPADPNAKKQPQTNVPDRFKMIEKD